MLLAMARDHGRAIEVLEETLATHPDHASIWEQLSIRYWEIGEREKSYEALMHFFVETRAPEWYARSFRGGHRDAGPEGAYRALRDAMIERSASEPVLSGWIAAFAVMTGDSELALTWLDRAYRERDPLLKWLEVWPLFDPLRPDPRFQDLLRRIGFPES